MNDNEKARPARDRANPNCVQNCTAPGGRQPKVLRLEWRRFERVEIDGSEYLRELDCSAACTSAVRCLAEYRPKGYDDVRDDAADYGRFHQENEDYWAGEDERHYVNYVCGPFPYLGGRS